jgi:hypothetical protein
MKFLLKLASNGEWFRGNEIASKSVDGPNRGDDKFVSQPQASINADTPKTEQTLDEREAKLALWMEEVKSFIRSIDINRL